MLRISGVITTPPVAIFNILVVLKTPCKGNKGPPSEDPAVAKTQFFVFLLLRGGRGFESGRRTKTFLYSRDSGVRRKVQTPRRYRGRPMGGVAGKSREKSVLFALIACLCVGLWKPGGQAPIRRGSGARHWMASVAPLAPPALDGREMTGERGRARGEGGRGGEGGTPPHWGARDPLHFVQ